MPSSNASDSVDQLASQVLESIEIVWLTIDELATLAHDLGIAAGFAVGDDINADAVVSDVARRSLLSKGALREGDTHTSVEPWFQLLIDAVADPTIVVRARHSETAGAFEWTFFLNEHIGVQQQISEDGVVAWAPFDQGDVLNLLFEAMGLKNTVIGSPAIDVLLAAGVVVAVEEAVQRGRWDEAVSLLVGVGWEATLAKTYVDGMRFDGASSMLVVLDRSQGDGPPSDLLWLSLGELGLVRLTIPALGAEDSVHLKSVSGWELASTLALAVGISPEGIDEEPSGERSP